MPRSSQILTPLNPNPTDHQLHPCAFFSRCFTSAERNYNVSGELLEMVLALQEAPLTLSLSGPTIWPTPLQTPVGLCLLPTPRQPRSHISLDSLHLKGTPSSSRWRTTSLRLPISSPCRSSLSPRNCQPTDPLLTSRHFSGHSFQQGLPIGLP